MNPIKRHHIFLMKVGAILLIGLALASLAMECFS